MQPLNLLSLIQQNYAARRSFLGKFLLGNAIRLEQDFSFEKRTPAVQKRVLEKVKGLCRRSMGYSHFNVSMETSPAYPSFL
jgi:hypothetical protein